MIKKKVIVTFSLISVLLVSIGTVYAWPPIAPIIVVNDITRMCGEVPGTRGFIPPWRPAPVYTFSCDQEGSIGLDGSTKPHYTAKQCCEKLGYLYVGESSAPGINTWFILLGSFLSIVIIVIILTVLLLIFRKFSRKKAVPINIKA